MTTTKPMNGEDRVMRKEGNLVSDMGGEKVMMSIHTGKYYNLGSTGGRIWDLLSEEQTLAALVEVLASEYDIEPAVCQDQVVQFLEHLTQEGLIEVTRGE
ncbi:lasso peptide biosynthesis PqqD family chaperone [Paenibacillus sp. NPDC056933]|uniref:lasso peptide biosynthesis PqqD family chaperone n=1 Tax=Paenibacillus sp. NPDC056933 TaxID=3345968 RepID=UPI00363B5A67